VRNAGGSAIELSERGGEFVEERSLGVAELADGGRLVPQLLHLQRIHGAGAMDGPLNVVSGLMKPAGRPLPRFALREDVGGESKKAIYSRTRHHWVAGTSRFTLRAVRK